MRTDGRMWAPTVLAVALLGIMVFRWSGLTSAAPTALTLDRWTGQVWMTNLNGVTTPSVDEDPDITFYLDNPSALRVSPNNIFSDPILAKVRQQQAEDGSRKLREAKGRARSVRDGLSVMWLIALAIDLYWLVSVSRGTHSKPATSGAANPPLAADQETAAQSPSISA